MINILLVAHVIGDFYLQTEKSLASKESKNSFRAHLIHAVVHILTLLLVLLYAYPDNFFYYLLFPLYGVFHYLIDVFKVYLKKRFSSCQARIFILDQLLHIIVLLCVYLIINKHFIYWNNQIINNEYISKFLMVLLVLKPANIIIQVVFKKYIEAVDTAKRGVKGAGATIGSLERLIILFLVLIPSYEAVAFIIAAKSIARHKNLDEVKFAELFLIGTLFNIVYVLIVVSLLM